MIMGVLTTSFVPVRLHCDVSQGLPLEAARLHVLSSARAGSFPLQTNAAGQVEPVWLLP